MQRGLVTVAVLGAFVLAVTPAWAAADLAVKCREFKAKQAGKKAATLTKSFGKNIKSPNDATLSAAISKAHSKFSIGFAKAESKGGCRVTGNSDAIERQVDTLVFSIIEELGPQTCGNGVRGGGEACDGSDDGRCAGCCQANCQCPCGNGVVEAGEQCDPPCSPGGCDPGEICSVTCQCVLSAPCDCGTPDPPTSLELTAESGQGTCGEIRNGSDGILLDLDCGYTYLGGGLVGVSPKQESHLGTTVYPVECCYGTTLALTASTPADTGSLHDCSSTGCFIGGPIPIVMSTPAFSTCIYNYVVGDARGSADCSTGDATIHLPVKTSIFLTGDKLPGRCNGGSSPGRACWPFPGDWCVGGLHALRPCSEGCPEGTCGCPGGGTCEDDTAQTQPCPICNPGTGTCNGGGKDGYPCEPHTPDAPGPYPTSYDCPPGDHLYYGFTNLPWEYTTGTQSKEAADGQFCGFCRDTEPSAQPGDTGGKCFEGDPDDQLGQGAKGCPDSATMACRPATYHGPGGGDPADIAECGDGVPCETDADCIPPYETCEQSNWGAFNQPLARKITATGTPAGDLRDRAPHAMAKVSVTCIPPTFLPYQDIVAGFPGPGVSSVPGVLQLKP